MSAFPLLHRFCGKFDFAILDQQREFNGITAFLFLNSFGLSIDEIGKFFASEAVFVLFNQPIGSLKSRVEGLRRSTVPHEMRGHRGILIVFCLVEFFAELPLFLFYTFPFQPFGVLRNVGTQGGII